MLEFIPKTAIIATPPASNVDRSGSMPIPISSTNIVKRSTVKPAPKDVNREGFLNVILAVRKELAIKEKANNVIPKNILPLFYC